MKKILIDTDILLDVFLVRKPFVENSEKIIELCFQKKIQGFTTPLIIANAQYVFSKVAGKRESLGKISELVTIINILAMNSNTVIEALRSGFSDFEDALQYQVAVTAKMDLILTRNIKDYKKSSLGIVDPETFLNAF